MASKKRQRAEHGAAKPPGAATRSSKRLRLRTSPLEYLNEDSINTIFSYLSPADVVCCERVSREWRNCARSWIASFGLRLHFPSYWDLYQSNGTLSRSDEYRKRAHQSHTFRLGHPSSVKTFSKSSFLQVKGDLVAWVLENHDHSENDHDIVLWQRLEPTRPGGRRLSNKLDLRCLSRTSRWRLRFSSMLLNPNGYIFLQAQDGRGVTSQSIHSLADNSVVRIGSPDYYWSRNTRRTIMGVDRLYQVEPVSDSEHFNLVAREIRSGKVLYQAHVPPLSSDPRLNPVVIQVHNNELLVHPVSFDPYANNEPSTFVIINGVNGHIIQELTPPSPLRMSSLCSGPISFSMALYPETSNLQVQHPSGFRNMTAFQTFSRDPSGSFSKTSIDVVLHDPALFGNARIDFPNRRAFSIPRSPKSPSGFCVHDIEPLRDPELQDIACRAMRTIWPTLSQGSNSPLDLTPDRCHFLTAPREVTLPPSGKPGEGRKRRTLQTQQPFNPMSSTILDNGMVLVNRTPMNGCSVLVGFHLSRADRHSFLFDFNQQPVEAKRTRRVQ